MISRASIESYAASIARKFQPQKIILFGSYAYGKPNADSDVDLMVLLPRRRQRRDSSTEIRTRLGYAGFPLDLLVWTPERLRQWAKLGDSFAREVIERGEVLYERRHAKLGA